MKIAVKAEPNNYIFEYLKKKNLKYSIIENVLEPINKQNIKSKPTAIFFQCKCDNISPETAEKLDRAAIPMIINSSENNFAIFKTLMKSEIDIFFLNEDLKKQETADIMLDSFIRSLEMKSSNVDLLNEYLKYKNRYEILKNEQNKELQNINFELQSQINTLSNLYTIGTVITSELKLSNVLALIMENLLGLTQGEVGSIFLIKDGKPEPTITWGLPENIIYNITDKEGNTILDIIKEEEDVILIEDFMHEERFHLDESQRVFIKTVLAIPLIVKGNTIGIIVAVNKTDEESFNQQDLKIAEYLANYASVAINNAQLHEMELIKTRMQQELQVAHDVQMALLPSNTKDIKGLEVEARCFPAREVGGDYYDFIPKSDYRNAVVIGDVSNKGVPASLLMVTTRSIIRAETNNNADSVDVITKTNSLLCSDTFYDQNMFVTLFYGFFDAETKKFDYTNAGHNWPILIKAEDKRIEYFKAGGLFLGQFDGIPYKTETVQLETGDLVFMYTDGITEERNPKGEMFGYERITEILVQNFDKKVTELMDLIFKSVKDFSKKEEQYDDMTVIIFRVR